MPIRNPENVEKEERATERLVDLIRALRTQYGVTLAELERFTGWPHKHLSDLMHGRRQPPKWLWDEVQNFAYLRTGGELVFIPWGSEECARRDLLHNDETVPAHIRDIARHGGRTRIVGGLP